MYTSQSRVRVGRSSKKLNVTDRRADGPTERATDGQSGLKSCVHATNKAVYTASLVAGGWAGAENLKNSFVTDGRTDRRTDRRTDGPTDQKVAYRVACLRPKKNLIMHFHVCLIRIHRELNKMYVIFCQL